MGKDSRQSPDLAELFDAGFEDRLNRPTAEGSALPNAAYTSGEFYRLEQRTVFCRNWVFAAFKHEVAGKGSALPVDVAGQPLVLVNIDGSSIRAFHNVCRHRGAKLVDAPRQGCKNLVCPNHSWSYSLEGKLLARPHFYGGDKHDVNQASGHRADLVEVKCAVWQDWVFVNLDGSAGEFVTHIDPLLDRLDGYDLGALEFSQRMDFEIEANWKLAIENFIEPYHVFSCHPWLNSFVGMAERAAPCFDGPILFCGYQFKQTDPARGEGLPYFPDLPEEKTRRGDWYVLFPNFAFEIFPDQVDVFIATPEGPNRCRETIALYFIGEGASAERYADARARVTKNWHDLNHEDIGIIERMQAGRSSDGFDGGVLSPYWDPVQQHFARLIVDSVQGK